MKNHKRFESTLILSEGKGRKGEGGLRTQGCLKANKPLVTVVTVVFNGEQFLEQTIQSVINQTYTNIEYIIIDGGSTDGTLDIIRKYEDKIDYWVSEADEGIADAFNKGVQLSLGEYINFQGDGDGFCKNTSVESVFSMSGFKEFTFISARIKRISLDGSEIYRSKEIKSFRKSSLLFRMSLPHQGLFTRLSYFEQYGLFDVDNVYCMDYEHLLRSYHDFPSVMISPVVVARWRDDGLGNGKTLDIFKEYDKIKRGHKIAGEILLYAVNAWILFKYYIKKVVTNA